MIPEPTMDEYTKRALAAAALPSLMEKYSRALDELYPLRWALERAQANHNAQLGEIEWLRKQLVAEHLRSQGSDITQDWECVFCGSMVPAYTTNCGPCEARFLADPAAPLFPSRSQAVADMDQLAMAEAPLDDEVAKEMG